MKEVMAFIRMNMINDTKIALSQAGFPAITCRKVYGRGKKKVNYELIEELIDGQPLVEPTVLESISENHRLIPKRFLTLIVEDEDVPMVVDILIKTNQTGNMGDGKIFVSNIQGVYRIRTGERDLSAV